MKHYDNGVEKLARTMNELRRDKETDWSSIFEDTYFDPMATWHDFKTRDGEWQLSGGVTMLLHTRMAMLSHPEAVEQLDKIIERIMNMA